MMIFALRDGQIIVLSSRHVRPRACQLHLSTRFSRALGVVRRQHGGNTAAEHHQGVQNPLSVRWYSKIDRDTAFLVLAVSKRPKWPQIYPGVVSKSMKEHQSEPCGCVPEVVYCNFAAKSPQNGPLIDLNCRTRWWLTATRWYSRTPGYL